MNLTDDEVLKFQRGTPIFIDDICAVYPARMGEIVDEGYSNFQRYLSILIIEKPISKSGDEEMRSMLEQLTDFQYLLVLTAMDAEINETVKRYDEVIQLSSNFIPKWEEMAFKYTVIEFNTSIKPFCFNKLFNCIYRKIFLFKIVI